MIRLRRGQAEIIGGLIVASALLLIVIPLVINLMTTSTTITTKGYTIRSQFEISRWSEKILSNNTYIINVGSVDIEVVRVWLKNGTLVEYNPWVRIPVASSIPIEVLGITNISEVDSIVTSRGRVFKLEEIIPPQITIPIQYPPLGLRSEDIVGGQSLKNYRIYANYSYDGSKWNPGYAGFYVDGDGWYIFNTSSGRWEKISKTSEIEYTDLDSNGARELVVLDSNFNVVKSSKGVPRQLYINMTFKELLNIDSNTSLITVFLKSLVGLSDQADVYVYITVFLIKSDNSSVYISSPATLSYAKVTGAGFMVVVYQGYIIFPVTQFVGYSKLQQNPGSYDLMISVSAVTQEDVEVSSSIEYVAVVKY
ncbi:MAG: hypothetical protein LM560_02215 [Desulfurococcaceae archaeon]|nr:hypothetical protein [Desulfurococcaceae archaeon]